MRMSVPVSFPLWRYMLLAIWLLTSAYAAASSGLGKESESAASSSQAAVNSAHAIVERTTVELVALIKEAQSHAELNEEQFYSDLGALLQRYVDFKSFSRAVMGKYASTKRIASLTESEAAKLQEQIERFTTIFTEALINTYGKGLLVFEGERIEVVPPSPDAAPPKPDRVTVKQLIYGDRAAPYEVYYSLRQNETGEWKIRNMILESTNLGKIYRNQFDNSYKVYEGDIDSVIDNWVSG